MSWMLQTFKDGIISMLMVSGPIVLLAAVIGLTMGLIQTVTNIQDQTTPSAIKIAGISVILIVGGSWIFGYLTNFFGKSFTKSFRLVQQSRNRISVASVNAARPVDLGVPPQKLEQIIDTNPPPPATGAGFQQNNDYMNTFGSPFFGGGSSANISAVLPQQQPSVPMNTFNQTLGGTRSSTSTAQTRDQSPAQHSVYLGSQAPAPQPSTVRPIVPSTLHLPAADGDKLSAPTGMDGQSGWF